MKIKFNSDDELPQNKTIEIPSMIIVLRAVFYEKKTNKYYPQVFLDVCINCRHEHGRKSQVLRQS